MLGRWLGFCVLIASFYILWQVRQLLLLVFTAVVLATALNRIVRQFKRVGIRNNRAIALTLSACFLLAVLFVWLVIPPFIEQFQNLLDLVPAVFWKLRSKLIQLEGQLPNFLPAPSSLSDLIVQLQPLSTQLVANFFTLFSTSIATLTKLLIVLVLTLMMLVNPVQYRQVFLKLFPSFYRQRADEILSKSEAALGSWLSGMVVNCLFIGIASGISLWILQVPLVLVHALMAGILNFIPNIGPLASAIFPVMIALLDAPWKVAAVLLVYFIIQNIESYWLSPTVMQNKVSLLPAVTLTAQFFFAKSFGLLGLILALPLTVVAKTWIEEVVLQDILDRWDRPRRDESKSLWERITN
ncbi:AI-2E family transporter [Lusitaniella coriacea LEGE 07157]|uniref:AI-2E family transporter n=1 Tax=Lusitaniella coriacea LEGE 07157 TaxID=945747 RepID=A0A8J7DY56_9CYAN|nr:AI-2E family transporter [Lusitaniella coriacea LEGE 07157]